MKKIFELKNVYKVYGEKELRQIVLKDINFDVYEEDIISIVGTSGAGKTTLLNVLSGLEKVSKGEITYEGKRLDNLSERQLANIRLEQFGFIFQNYCLVSSLSVKDNIMLPSVVKKNKVSEEDFKQVIETLGLENKLNSMPNKLSGGEKQRVAIARAILSDPKVIFADEPTGNLDSDNGDAVFELLFRLSKQYKKTLIYVTHDLQRAELASRKVVVKDGVINEK